jgi:hypothetical protein
VPAADIKVIILAEHVDEHQVQHLQDQAGIAEQAVA